MRCENREVFPDSEYTLHYSVIIGNVYGVCCPVSFSTECTEFSRLRKMESATLRTVPRREKNKSLETGMPRHCASGTAPGHFFHHRRSFRRFMHLTFCWRFALPYTFRVKDTFLCPRISERDFISNSGISIALTANVCRIS